ncbi:MAG: 6-pyruvoyltetrahydropterin synthase [Fimbriimonadales bacterium]|nr:MAG: 6-pyruvoyltetrahydropterin synthase [Fimbriimonadales bacterium]
MTQRVAYWFAFEASHFYHLPHLNDAENARLFGKATRHHGHNYRVQVVYRTSPQEPPRRFEELARATHQRIDSQFDHRCINLEHPAFQAQLPTTENLALYLWRDLRETLGAPVETVSVHESETLASTYSGEQTVDSDGTPRPVIAMTRLYTFSAAHRLYNPQLSDEQNRALYGKCSSPHGHGHDYKLEITVKGIPDPITGMVMNITTLDALVNTEVLAHLDHRFLNAETPPFDQIPPTSENLVAFIVARLQPHLQGAARLTQVRLWETPRSAFEWTADA